MWTDTHLHLDANEYAPDRELVTARARDRDVTRFVVPAVCRANFDTVQQLAHQTPGVFYCLGIHPMYVHNAQVEDLDALHSKVQECLNDPLFVGIGEIGLDGFEPNPDWTRQTLFFYAQLRLAREFDLPVVMHVRRSQDLILKGLRQFKPKSGIAHAFNGSFQQAEEFLKLNMCLGFGGACTFTRALQIRRLATELPLEALVLETDGPDIAPSWIAKERNAPEHLPRIAQVVAGLRGIDLPALSAATQANAIRVLPKLQP